MMAAVDNQSLHIDVHYVTRVEGHGNIVVNLKEGAIERCELQIVEAPRFFEAMLCGQPYQQASHLSSRICGICAVTHGTASLRAVENALGVEPSEQTILLRKLNLCGEMIDSHILHIYMLVAPDLLGVGSVIPLAESNPDVVLRALRMKKLAGDLCAVIGGRHTHPIALNVGGFAHYPTIEQLSNLCERIEGMRRDLEDTIDLFQTLSLPAFERETEYLALRQEDEYCLMDGRIMSTDGGSWSIEEYKAVTNEFMVDHSTAKHTRHNRQSYMVGALARFNTNYDLLHPKAEAAAKALNLAPLCTNPYLITIAQLVETVHFTEEAFKLIQKLLEAGINREELVPITRMSGEGVGSCEAPRGTLYHHYVIEDGIIKEANCIIPTNQNLANIEADMYALVPLLLERSTEEITLALEMLVRAYDPCISCSTHMLDVEFI
jgi:sulfhydrogenase subunit alpha